MDSCEPGIPAASDATCDGVDDDCNGDSDEGYLPAETACGTGACAAAGELVCLAGGVLSDTCQEALPALDDPTCDLVDDDCNGSTDEGYVPTPTTCGEGACFSVGELVCLSDGTLEDTCVAGDPADDDVTCDGVDDDCNGGTDEGYIPVEVDCGDGACATTSPTTCENGDVIDTCVAGEAADDDSFCDYLDNDCDGFTDEDVPGLGLPCDTGDTDACENGVWTCDDVGGVFCPETVSDIVEACDTAEDDDCDGTANEGCLPETVEVTAHSVVFPWSTAPPPAGNTYDVSAAGGEAAVGRMDAQAGGTYSIELGFYPALLVGQ